MAYLGSFNAHDIEPADRSALPAGEYTALISNSEWKDSKSGAQYLALTLQVLDGPHKGRFLWHNLNLNHPTPQASEIAQRELSAICRATGQMTINDSEQLHDIPVIVKVAYIEPKNGYDEKNQIKQWKPAGSASAVPIQAPAPAAKPAPQAPAPAAKPAPQAAARATRAAPPAAPKTPPPAPAAVVNKPWAKPAEAVVETADAETEPF